MVGNGLDTFFGKKADIGVSAIDLFGLELVTHTKACAKLEFGVTMKLQLRIHLTVEIPV